MSPSNNLGNLYLLPAPLVDTKELANHHAILLPSAMLTLAQQLRYFVVENAKTARAILKHYQMPCPIAELCLHELNQHTPKNNIEQLLEPVFAGHDLGLMSDAGCPAVADPGAQLVAIAQQKGIRVVPWVGPSSILLALMASGLNGQSFAFHGYLPAPQHERQQAIKQLEQHSKKTNQTQICIETPFRNQAFIQTFLETAAPSTQLCIGFDITGSKESIITKTIAEWKKTDLSYLDKTPCIFLWLA